jgi:RHS repeat-associated protein
MRGFGDFDLGLHPLGGGNRSRGNWALALHTPRLLATPKPARRSRTTSEARSAALPDVGQLRMVPGLRTLYSNTYESSSGVYVARVSTQPVNYRSNGLLEPINDKLRRSHGMFVDRADSDRLRLPLRIDNPALYSQGGSSLHVQLLGASSRSRGAISGTKVRYRNAYRGVSVSLQASPGSLEFAFSLATARAQNKFRVALTLGAGLHARMVDHNLLILNRRGKLRLRVPAPLLLEQAAHGLAPSSSGVSRVRTSLSGSRSRLVLTYVLSHRWLDGRGRRFPVVLDPQVSQSPSTAGDCTIFSGAPTGDTNCLNSETYDTIGAASGTYRTLMNFPSDPGGIAADSEVLGASLSLSFQVITGGSVSYEVLPLQDTFTTAQTASWNDSVTGSSGGNSIAWNCAGGDYVGCEGGSSTTPAAAGYGSAVGAGPGTVNVAVTALVQSWVDGSYSSTEATPALMVSPTSTTGSATIDRVGSGSTAPSLTIYYSPRLGADPGSTVPLTSLDSTTSLGLNVANGDAQLTGTDFNIAGTAGMNLSLSHTNNGSTASGGWTLDQPAKLTASDATDTADVTNSDGSISVWNAVPNSSAISAGTYANLNSGTYSPPAGTTGSLCEVQQGGYAAAPTQTASDQQALAFVGSGGQVWDSQLTNGSWSEVDLGGSVATGSNLSEVIDSSGYQHIFYDGSNGQLWQWYWNGTSWLDQDIGGSLGTGVTPSAYYGGGQIDVAFQTSSGALWQWYGNGISFSEQNLSAGSTSPPAVLVDGGGTEHVYYMTSNGQVWQDFGTPGGSFTLQDLGGSGNPYTSLSVWLDSGGQEHVVYEGSNNQIYQFYYNGSSWADQELGGGGEAAVGTTSPSMVEDSGGNEYVTYSGANGQIWRWYWNNSNSSWTNQDIGGSVVSGTSPTSEISSTGVDYVFYSYASAGGMQIAQWDLSPNLTWTNQMLGSCTPENPAAAWELTFDSSGQRWDFNSAGQLITEYDRNGNAINYSYNANGTVNYITDTEGRTFTYGYTSGQLTSITDSNISPSRSVGFGYTGSQLVNSTDAAGRETQYAYNSSGQLDQITDPKGYVTQISYPTTPSDGASFEVDIARAAPTTGGSALTTTYWYYSSGARVPSGYPSCGTDPGGEQPYGFTIVTNPVGHWTVDCYDTHDRVYQTIDEYGHRTTTTYNADDETTAVENPLGNVTGSTYDACDRLTSTSAGAGGPQSTTSYGSGVSSSGTCSATSPNQYQPSAASSPAGTGGGALTTQYFYDQNGNLRQESESNGHTLRFSYSSGQMTSSTDADGTGTAVGSSGYNVNTTAYTYAYSGQLLSSLVVAPPAPLVSTTTDYDADGRVTSVKDGDSHTTTYTYNGDDQALTDTFADSSTITNTYDGDGNMSTSVDSAGGTTSYGYDHDNRQTSETDPGVGGQPSTTVSYGYNGADDLTSFSDGGGTVAYGYNDDDLVTSAQEPTTGSPTTTFSYNAADQLVCTLYPNAVAVQDAYDAYGDITNIQAATGTGTNAGCNSTSSTNTPYGTLFDSYAYTYGTPSDQTGLRQSETINGTQYNYAYNNLNQLVGVSGGAVDNYSYDPDGNMLSRTDPTNGLTLQMAYQPAGQVCAASETSMVSSCPGTLTYTYDGAGEATNLPTVSATGGSLSAAGLTYTDRKQTQQITPPGGSAQQLNYDGSGQEDVTQVGNAPTGGTAAPVLENSSLGVSAEEPAGASAATASTTTYFTRAPNGTLLGERAPSGNDYYVEDANGSVVALTNSSGAVANTYTYDPYGATTSQTGTAPNPFGFDGGLDAPGGLIHFGAREYDPLTGSWTQPDPDFSPTDPSSDSLYEFAGDDPVNQTDPNGTVSEASGAQSGEVWISTNCQLVYVGTGRPGPGQFAAATQCTWAAMPPGHPIGWLDRCVGFALGLPTSLLAYSRTAGKADTLAQGAKDGLEVFDPWLLAASCAVGVLAK